MKTKKKILLYAVNALVLILIGICFLRIHSYSNILSSQQAASYWKGDSEERFAQVSCFFPVNNLANIDLINTFRKTIGSKLVDAGMEPKKEEEGEYWTDCYSATDSLTVKGDRNSSEVTAIGVGGDFFLFHPYVLLSGSYINEDDLMEDRVVLDYELAWKLFGGTALEGMTVTIDGKPYYVAGVVRRETDKFSDKAYKGEPVMFMSYTALTALKENTGINCYEIAMPDHISKFAKSFVQESFKTAKGVVVENSTRYNFTSIFKMFEDFGDRSIADTGVSYPYWENAARISEVYIARLYVFILLLLIFPLICLILLAARLIKFIIAKLKILKFKVWDAWDDRYAREAAWKERRKQKQSLKKQNHTVSGGRITAWKERCVQKRRARNLKTHERKQKQETLPEIKVSKQKKKALPRKKNSNQAVSVQTEDPLEKELIPDIESIVREIMEEMGNPDNK